MLYQTVACFFSHPCTYFLLQNWLKTEVWSQQSVFHNNHFRKCTEHCAQHLDYVLFMDSPQCSSCCRFRNELWGLLPAFSHPQEMKIQWWLLGIGTVLCQSLWSMKQGGPGVLRIIFLLLKWLVKPTLLPKLAFLWVITFTITYSNNAIYSETHPYGHPTGMGSYLSLLTTMANITFLRSLASTVFYGRRFSNSSMN